MAPPELPPQEEVMNTVTLEGQLTIPRCEPTVLRLKLEGEDDPGFSREEWVRPNERFQISGLYPGTYRVEVKAGRIPVVARLVIPHGAERATLELSYQPSETIAGSVYDGESGAPLGGVRVDAQDARRCPSCPEAAPRTTWSDSNGQFRFDGLDLKSYDLRFERDGYSDSARGVHVGTEDFEVELFPL